MRIYSSNVNSFDGTKNRFNTRIKRDEICLRKERAEKIAKYIMNEKHKIDIAMFQEVDCLEGMLDYFVSFFKRVGYKVEKPNPMDKNTKFCNVIVVKKDVKISFSKIENSFSSIRLNRWLEIMIQEKRNNRKLYLLNFHRRDSSDVYSLLKYFESRKNDNTIIMGDFNAARKCEREKNIKETDIIFENEEFLNLFTASHYKEIGDGKFTFFNQGNKHDGRRLDHCFVCDAVSKYCMGYTELNEETVTDHSAIILDID